MPASKSSRRGARMASVSYRQELMLHGEFASGRGDAARRRRPQSTQHRVVQALRDAGAAGVNPHQLAKTLKLTEPTVRKYLVARVRSGGARYEHATRRFYEGRARTPSARTPPARTVGTADPAVTAPQGTAGPGTRRRDILAGLVTPIERRVVARLERDGAIPLSRFDDAGREAIARLKREGLVRVEAGRARLTRATRRALSRPRHG